MDEHCRRLRKWPRCNPARRAMHILAPIPASLPVRNTGDASHAVCHRQQTAKKLTLRHHTFRKIGVVCRIDRLSDADLETHAPDRLTRGDPSKSHRQGIQGSNMPSIRRRVLPANSYPSGGARVAAVRPATGFLDNSSPWPRLTRRSQTDNKTVARPVSHSNGHRVAPRPDLVQPD